MENSKRVIVAGAEGFIGQELVAGLKKAGYLVTALTHRADTVAGADRTVKSEGKDLETIAEDLRPFGYDGFFCLAWRGTAGPLRSDYLVQIKNIETVCRYTELAASVLCRRFVFASSINEFEAYGCLMSEKAAPPQGYIYGSAKLAAHMMAETVAYGRGIPFISVMFTNVYGERKRSGRLIDASVEKLLKGEHCSFTSGNQTYDFIYITDAVGAVISVFEKGHPSAMYYIGSGRPAPLRDFLIEMRDEIAPSAKLGLGEIPFMGYDLKYDCFDTDRVRRDTGYENAVSFCGGIRKTAEYIAERENRNGCK